MALDSGWDRGKILPLGGVAPGNKSMEQSLDRWGGRLDALVLLKAMARSEYSIGKSEVSVSNSLTVNVCTDKGETWLKYWSWQIVSNWMICPSFQEICKLCLHNHGKPRITGLLGEWMTQNLMISLWSIPTCMWTSSVMCVTFPSPMGRLSSASTAKWE